MAGQIIEVEAKKMKKVFVVGVLMGSMALAVQTHAGMPGLKDLVPGAASGETSAPVSQESIVQDYVAANVLVLTAQEKFAEAFGLKEQAAAARAEADALQGASTEAGADQFKSSVAVSESVMAAVQAAMDAGTELSEDGRGSYVEGLSLAVQSVVATKGLAVAASEFSASAQSQIKSASMTQKMKVTKQLSAGMFVAKELPGYTSRLSSNVSALVTYAKSADIPTPDDPTEALASL